MALRTLYPALEPYDHGYLPLDGEHAVYYEQCGNPEGKPAVFVHGGPGGGGDKGARRFFDPEHYRIIVFDQRGAGRSRPKALLEDNTTAALIADMERLRTSLGITRWLVFGGSWDCCESEARRSSCCRCTLPSCSSCCSSLASMPST